MHCCHLVGVIRFTPFNPNASFVETANTTGLPFLNVAFAAISTGESVIAFANLLIEFPVKGAITMQSNGILGPSGSAPTIELIALKPVISSIFLIHSAPSPNLVFVD